MIVAWLILPAQVVAQDFFCGTSIDDPENFEKAIVQHQNVSSCSSNTNRGLYLPSTDTIRARVVFAKFQDDINTVQYWPQNGFPSTALTIIDSSVTVGSTHRYNLTNYYRTFSQGRLIVLGKVDTVTLSRSIFDTDFTGGQSFYENTFEANKAVIQQLSNRPNFELYDDWTKSAHNHGKCADGDADLIIIVWRSNQFNGGSVNGFAGLGSGSAFWVDQIKVLPGWNNPPGSGVSLIRGVGFDSNESFFSIMIHELGHLFLGGNHPFTQTSSGIYNDRGLHKFPSMMTSSSKNMFMPNPLESEYLGWADVVEIDADGTYELEDFISSGKAYKWSNTVDNDYYYLFYMNNSNVYNDFAMNSNDDGIFVMNHRFKPSPTSNGLLNSYLRSGNDSFYNKLISSEGDYDWMPSNPFYTTDGKVLFNRVRTNRKTGQSHHTALHKLNPCESKYDWITALGDYSRQGTPSAAPIHSSCYYSTQDYAFADTTYNYLGSGFISSFSYENNRAYFSAITNPAAKKYLVYNSSAFEPLDFAIQVKPLNGSTIEFYFETNHDPFDIDTDRVWSGEIFIPDGQLVVVSDNATLTILPDTRIFLGKNNARIATTGGGKIIALGTQNKPITFTTSYDTESWSHANEWGQLFLGSGGNRFEWCVFEYGTKHIEVASRDNEIRNSIFRNGWRGISSYSNQSGSGPTNSEVLIDQVLMTGNRTVGFVGYYSDSKVSNVTITHNGEAGAWYEYANGLSLHKSRIDCNATSSSTRSGVEANQGSVVHLLRYHSGSYLQGDNSIRDQPQYQVFRGSGSTLHMGNYYTIGEPGWSNIEGGSSYLVRNYGSGSITAHENWWGISEPESSNFYGSVDYDFFQSSAVNVFEATSLPVESHYYTDQYLKVRPQTSQESADMDRKAEQNRGRLRQHASQLRQRLDVASPDPDDVLDFLDLHTLMWDPQWYGADLDANRALLSDLYAEVTKQSAMTSNAVRVIELQLRDWVSTSPKRAAQEALVLLESQQHPHIRLAATQALMSTSEQNGDLVAARSYLSQVSELQRGAGYQKVMVEAYVAMMEGIFATRPEQRFLKGSGMSEQLPSKSTEDPKDEPVLTVFPNPFNPEAVVTIELRSEQRVRIEVYNTIGQRVLTLMDGQLTTGRHSVRMDGSKLSSGVYLIRVHTGQQTLTHRVTLIK